MWRIDNLLNSFKEDLRTSRGTTKFRSPSTSICVLIRSQEPAKIQTFGTERYIAALAGSTGTDRSLFRSLYFPLAVKTDQMTRAVTAQHRHDGLLYGMSTWDFCKVWAVLWQELQYKGVGKDGKQPEATSLQYLCRCSRFTVSNSQFRGSSPLMAKYLQSQSESPLVKSLLKGFRDVNTID